MQVGVGYSDAQDTDAAGTRAARGALAMAKRSDPCDMVLLFATAWHDPHELRMAVASVVGEHTAIIGGGAVGAITNDAFGYGGEQVGLAAIWLEGCGVELFAEGRLANREENVGIRLGKRMAAHAENSGNALVNVFMDCKDAIGVAMMDNQAVVAHEQNGWEYP